MLRGARFSLVIAIVISLITSPIVHAHGGGGGGGHGGGGGGHMGGGGHFGGGGGHYGGSHYGGAQYGTSHMGNYQHYSGNVGQQHYGGQQTIHSGSTQHLGNQSFSNHSLGNQNFSGTQHNLGNQQQLHSNFYQSHGLGSGSSVQHGVGNLNHQVSHQSSNFLANHHAGNVTSVTTAHQGSFLSGQHGLGHQNFGVHGNNAFNHSSLHHGGYYGNHGYGYHNGYGGGGYGGGFWRYPYYGYGYGLGLGLGLGLGFGLGFGYGGWGLGYGLGYYGGYGLGYYGGYGGYGYGGYGYGFGGYGYGLNAYGYGLNGYGYGSSYGYPSWGCLGYWPSCAYQPYGYGGYLNSDAAYGMYAGTNGLATSGLAYAPTTLGVATATDAAPAVVPSTVSPNSPDLDKTAGAASGLPTADQFARIGETAFKSRDYKGAVRAWRHGLVDDPENGVLVMMLGQALFATEQFTEAAGAVQAAVQTLPPDKWDVVIKNFRDLYGKGEDYTTQLRALEKAVRTKPDEPSYRFLLGYHYGYLGYPSEAVKQLEKCVSLAPRDEIAQKILRLFNDKLPKNAGVPTSGETPVGTSQGVPTPGDFIPPPPLNTEPSTAGLNNQGAKIAPPTAKPD